MPKINNVEKYSEVNTFTGKELILGSLEANIGKTVNIPINVLLNYFSEINGDFNGVVGLTDSPEDIRTGYWIANEKGIYSNFGGVENIWATGIITFTEGAFQIKEFVEVNLDPLYNDDFDI